MKIKNTFLVPLILWCFSCNNQIKKINGVSFVASRDSINQKHITSVIKIQSNYVALMPFGFIRDLSAPKITFNSKRQWFGETENGLKQYAKTFEKYKIKIMVKPQIWVWKGEYTGFIEMKTQENWGILEESYANFILTYAKVAQEIHADILCIGTELEKFVAKRPKYWQKLIKKIRKIYKGKLTYAANWDEYKRISFWKELDFIGIDAYFPLSDKKTPLVKDFEFGWKTYKKEIMEVQQRFQKPILFTEYGYRSIDYSGKEPWNSNRVKGNINLAAQTNGLKAIHNQFWKEGWFAGGFIWKWFHTNNKVSGGNNNRFTPQNKPAEQLLKELYKQ
ncbi:MAG: glycoside hydrolase family 113 [Polaribacter sp.]